MDIKTFDRSTYISDRSYKSMTILIGHTEIFDPYLPDIYQSQLHHLWGYYHSGLQPNHIKDPSSGS